MITQNATDFLNEIINDLREALKLDYRSLQAVLKHLRAIGTYAGKVNLKSAELRAAAETLINDCRESVERGSGTAGADSAEETQKKADADKAFDAIAATLPRHEKIWHQAQRAAADNEIFLVFTKSEIKGMSQYHCYAGTAITFERATTIKGAFYRHRTHNGTTTNILSIFEGSLAKAIAQLKTKGYSVTLINSHNL